MAARDKITPVELARNTGVDVKAATIGTVVTPANGAYIDVNDVDTDRLMIHFKNTWGGVAHATIKAGVFTGAPEGDLDVAVAATTGEQGVVIESSRFKDADGYILIDFDGNFAGLVGAYLLP